MDTLLYVDDSLIIEMVQVSLDLRYSRISLMVIMYFDFIPCCLSEVALRGDDWVHLEVFCPSQ